MRWRDAHRPRWPRRKRWGCRRMPRSPTGSLRFRKQWAAAAAAGALAVAGFGWYFSSGFAPLAEAGPKHVAVLPFLNIGDDPANRLTSDGLLETLTSRLSDLDSSGKTLWVVPASEVRQRKVTDPRDAVKQLGVNLVVTGSVQRQEKGVRLTVNLVDPRNLRQIGSAVISESNGDFLRSGSRRGSEAGRTAPRSTPQTIDSARQSRPNTIRLTGRISGSHGLPASMGSGRELGEGCRPV